ncbi:MAG: hypothetical protein M0Q94_03115 [Candidatus Cloacimonetes bacterium]|nr:hypothetical protein [Candidatus Cloacimonadota bacterium]
MDILDNTNRFRSLKTIFSIVDEKTNKMLEEIHIEELGLSISANKVLFNYSIHTIGEILLLNPQELLDMKYAKVIMVNEIFEKCRDYIKNIFFNNELDTQELVDFSDTEPVDINQFYYNEVTEKLLVLLPLFSDKDNFPKVIDLHGSYKGEESIHVLNLNVRALNILIDLNIDTIKQLLLTKSSTITAEKNCGIATINEITNNIMSFYFVDNSITDLYEFIDAFEQGNTKNKTIFLEYLCHEDGYYNTYQNIAGKYELSRQRVQQIVSIMIKKAKKYIEVNNKVSIFDIINNALKTYKGTISIKDLSNENSWSNNSEIDLKKLVRLYYLLFKSIDIDNKKYTFQENHDKHTEYDEYKPKVSYANVQENNNNKNGASYIEVDIDYQELFMLKNISTNKYKDIILKHITENDGIMCTTNLKRLSRMNGFDYNIVIDSINSEVYEIFKHVCPSPFLLNDGEGSWEVDIYYKNKDNWLLSEVDKTTVQLPEEEYVVPSQTRKDCEKGREIADKINRSLKERVTSYKSYWLMALIYCAEKNLSKVTFQEMGQLMIAFAWKDVLVDKKTFSKLDQIPIIIGNLYFDLELNKSSNFEDVLSTLKNESNSIQKDILKIVNYVQYSFLKEFVKCEYIPKKPNEFIMMISKKSNQEGSIYELKADRIIIKDNFIKNLSEIKKCIISHG